MVFNSGAQIALPSPDTTPGQFTVQVPVGANYSVEVINNNVFMLCHIQSLNTIPANPPTTPITFTYRALNSSWRDDTATQFNNFVDFVTTSVATYVLTVQTPLA